MFNKLNLYWQWHCVDSMPIYESKFQKLVILWKHSLKSVWKSFFIKTWNVTECMEPTLGHEQSVTIFWWTWSMSHGHDHNWARCQIGVNCITLYRVKLGQSGDTGFVSVFSIFFWNSRRHEIKHFNFLKTLFKLHCFCNSCLLGRSHRAKFKEYYPNFNSLNFT